MKKVIALIATIAMLFISAPALADYIDFSSGASTTSPPYSGSGATVFTEKKAVYNANPTTPYIEVEIAGKTCKFLSSAGTFAPQGCNYTVEVAPSGEITFPRTGCEVPTCS